MKSAAWSSHQSALPPEARIGGERDDDDLPPSFGAMASGAKLIAGECMTAYGLWRQKEPDNARHAIAQIVEDCRTLLRQAEQMQASFKAIL